MQIDGWDMLVDPTELYGVTWEEFLKGPKATPKGKGATASVASQTSRKPKDTIYFTDDGFEIRKCRGGWRLLAPFTDEDLGVYPSPDAAAETADRFKELMTVTSAYHEAGHVVAAIERKRAFGRVSIESCEEYAGAVTPANAPWTKINPSSLSGKAKKVQEARFLREAFILMAGPAAERVILGDYNEQGMASDVVTILAVFKKLGLPYEAEYDRVREEAEEWVSRSDVWAKIEAVANALLEHQTLSSVQVRRICAEVEAEAKKSRLRKHSK
jgi:hypothetical protein